MQSADTNNTAAVPTNRSGSVTARLVNRTTMVRQSVWNAITDLASSHVYSHASAIAFNALLSFFPFVVLLLVIFRKVLQWPAGYEMFLALLKDDYLPAEGGFITRNLRVVAANSTTAIFSLLMLMFTSSGVFAPIEVALNRAWRISEERSFWRSKMIALLLVFICGLLAMGSVYVTASTQSIMHSLLGSLINNPFFRILTAVMLKLLILPVTITIFFLVYYLLPNRRVPVRRVLPAAIFIGVFWELVKYFFVWSLPILDFASVYGPFYVTISLIMWAFISSLVLLLGANLSALWPD